MNQQNITVSIAAKTDVPPYVLASHAAHMCYSDKLPKMGQRIDVENKLLKTGHLTAAAEHWFATFTISGIPVSNMVFGLHLPGWPFYNTCQRSGRFSPMYDNPDMNGIKNTLNAYYPDVSQENINKVCNWIGRGLKIYADNKESMIQLAAEMIGKERPNATSKYITNQAPKLSQEQLRMFISMISPTALDWTVNLATVSALYRTAWTPFLRDTMDKVAGLIKSYYPDMSCLFDIDPSEKVDFSWEPKMSTTYHGIKTKPELTLLSYSYDDNEFVEDKSYDSIDTLRHHPMYMDNQDMYVKTRVHLDAGATGGQDQRHRTIMRSTPEFTGYFYLPPLLDIGGLKNAADEFMQEFYSLDIPDSMRMSIAPYGAMIQYRKHADVNALMHEQAKRTCWCAQEAIYHLACQLRSALAKEIGENAKLMKYLTPPCLSRGKCAEGARYCGRDITDKINYFRQRQI
ncbi:MAG: FAD-dependent thymidylate synthase [Alphaproteobacteria bacterium]|nr:FAD-dependent thymidylate synthase [Alphaproteobacteria bacterium]